MHGHGMVKKFLTITMAMVKALPPISVKQNFNCFSDGNVTSTMYCKQKVFFVKHNLLFYLLHKVSS